MLLIATSFLLGISQILWIKSVSYNQILISLLISVCLIIVYFIIKKKQSKNYNLFSYYLLLIFMISSIGFSYIMIVVKNNQAHQLSEKINEPIWLNGTIQDLPVDKANKTKFVFIIDKQQSQYSFKKILVSWYEPKSKQEIKPGQSWRLKLKIKPPHSLNNPSSFDYTKWLFRHSIDATATVKDFELLTSQKTSLITQINLLRLEISTLIKNNIKSERVTSLLLALSIGDKSQISSADSGLFQETGTSHLIAISGLHIGLMAFVGVLIGRLFFSIFANQIINRIVFETVFAVTFALIYALLAGLSISTIRALIMVVVFAIAYVYKINISRWSTWSLALVIVLLFDPLSVLDVGFWFSFGAVAVLMFGFSGRKISSYKILSFAYTQVAILLGMMPLMVIVFNKINFLTPIANIIVLPLASLLLIPFLFATLFMSLINTFMATYLFKILALLSTLLFNILDGLQNLDFLSFSFYATNAKSLILIIVCVFILLLPRLFRWKYVVLLLLIPIVFQQHQTIKNAEFKVNVMDVGQGLSIIISTKNHHIIYDTGAKFDSGFSLANTVIIPYLNNQGIKNVDKLLLSHIDNDHAGGKNDIINLYKDIDVYGVKGQYQSCDTSLSWMWDDVHFQVVSPFELIPYLGNNSSCVLKVFSKYGSILLTADIEEPIEYRLVNHALINIQSDVLIVPHHGSRTSSSEDFINKVDPKIAINSSGFMNQFNHPHPLITKLYMENKITFLDTQNDGMIGLLFTENSLKITKNAILNKHVWQPD